MQALKVYKRPRRTAVELTSLLDLLFVMIFVSLMQQKEVTPPPVVKQVPKESVEKAAPQKTSFSITATFQFYGTPENPNLPKGSYVMQGSYSSKTMGLKLGGVGWLERPESYDMVPLSGTINEAGTLFTGRIEFIGCKTFTLKRMSKGSSTPISGDWKGSYDCTQGLTGLTLSIE